ncbi:p-hydroxybenzoic acid efflux pump subunit AaeB [Rhodopseudomonas palustris]|uniref:FUSC family protein n=1 Tax=Rhodopseudomonas palustris (strain ATCC BAA-98 / CGA009) TaxID=258594 RepID=Q6NA63_RHOPA|nr:FUSC family protein [Rhodopseudomonas palustris]OPF91422.1 fusaric acid resistance protein [Rhodopseudomonas palustris]QQM02820.1 p-hydroxybenzoic acid efflux pump subunit AaeB [Rhodopseudomonas palustris]RJF60422.1 FUSC family protein [Rhodopseudomonas palustris]WAB78994.1 FUSC family protein [Rhodopseudomonas palustris]WCL91456.1 FUSC family protein [Rhodopseudomonas palustris CGA009]
MSVFDHSGREARRFWHGLRQAVLSRLQALAPRVLFGLRLSASVCLALFATYYLELQNAFWAATTAAIVCQPNLGASIQKGRFRAIGSALGALVMVALLAAFPQQREPALLLLALFCGLCAAAATLLRNLAAYAAALAGITSAIIFADTVTDPSSAPFLAIVRVGEIYIGIWSATVVAMLTGSGSARRQLCQTLGRISANLLAGFSTDVTSGRGAADSRAARIALARELGPLNLAIDAALGEQSPVLADRARLRRIPFALLDALTSWRNAARFGERSSVAETTSRGELRASLAAIDPARFQSDPAGFRDSCRTALRRIDATRSSDVDAPIVVAARDVVQGLAAAADGMLAKGAVGSNGRTPRASFVVADPLPALVNGARTAAAILAVTWFWVVTAWPSGPFAIVFTAVATLIFASFGDHAGDLAKDYTIGVALMAVVGSVLYFGVLPALSSFAALIAVLSVLFIVLGVMQAGPWHSVVFLAMTISSLPLLGVGNPITYDASAYFNLALAIVSGSAVGAMFFVAIPVVPPSLRLRRLIALSLRDLRRLLSLRSTPDQLRWTALMARRIELLPSEATADDVADLLALHAVGRAALRLEQEVSDHRALGLLRAALTALADGHLADARMMLVTWRGQSLALDPPDDAEHRRWIASQSHIAVIIDAIDNHPVLLATPFRGWQPFFKAFR